MATLSTRLLAQAPVALVSLVLDGLGPGLDPDALDLILAPFLTARLPVTCVVDLLTLTAPDRAERPLLDRLAGLVLANPGLIDLALPIGKLPRTERYFQIRRAGELRQAVLAAFATGPAAATPFPVVSLVDRGDDPNIDHTAFRGAGFRVHLRSGDGPYTPVLAGRGELAVTGGLWSPLDAPDLDTRLSAALAQGDDLLLSVHLTGDLAADSASAGRIAALLAKDLTAGTIRMTSPARLRLHAGAGLPLDAALLLLPGTGPDAKAAVLSFVSELSAAGLPLTLGARGQDFGPLPGTVSFCPSPGTDPAASLPLCLQGDDRQGAAVALHVAPNPAHWPAQGLDPDGHLRLAPRQLSGPADSLLDLSPLEDHVIMLRAEDLLPPIRRAHLAGRLVEAQASGAAYFHSLPGLADHLIEAEPVLKRLWSVRRRRVTDPVRTPSPDSAERQRLVEDARLAWSFIDRFTDPETGLCAGTVQILGTTIVNPEVTMWDLASQLHGIRVARQLDFIAEDEAKDRVARLLAHLPATEIDGLRLPPSMFRSDDLGTALPGFDICDTGRFLVALTAAQDAGLVTPLEAGLVVAGWDLAGAIREGRPHSHVNGRWRDKTLSHCTPYIRRGMAPWGFDLVSPHDGLAPLDGLASGSETDRQIAFLYDVARIGQVGVEPVLLERLELGPDPGADLVAEVLFDAQLDWFETTGLFKCASEAPLNFAPWFSYQGLRVGALGPAAWVVRGHDDAVSESADFQTRAELLGTKSAYLWAALRAHDWCDDLIALMRQKTRIEGLGFSVGLFSSEMTAMTDYTDLNTNGIILAAIGHALR